jgi:hypothetical protein
MPAFGIRALSFFRHLAFVIRHSQTETRRNPRNITFYAFNPNSEVGNEIEKTRRAPGMVGRVTPCAPRLQPAGAKFPRRRPPDPLSISIFLEFPVPPSGFGVKAPVPKKQKHK